MAKRRIVLTGFGSQLSGLRWEFEDRLSVGRSQSHELWLNHPSVSPQQAEIYPSPRGWVVRDLNSTNGTFVNGVRVEKAPWTLKQDDLLQFGSLAVRVTTLEQGLDSTLLPREPLTHLKTSGPLVAVQAVARRSWEQGLETLARQDGQRVQEGKQLLTLLRGGYHLARVNALDDMLRSVLDDTVAVLKAQRGVFILADPATGGLEVRAVSPAAPDGAPRAYSRSLVRRCYDQGQSLLCRDAGLDADAGQGQSVRSGDMASIICALLRSPRQRLGILHLDRGPAQDPFTEDDLHLADAIAASVSAGVECAQELARQRARAAAEAAGLAERAVGLHDPQTARHGHRVAAYALLLADALDLPARERRQLEAGAALHDLGKLAFDRAFLHKGDDLTPTEAERLKGHPLEGVALAEGVSALADALPVIRSHHERWDGTGYPDRLAGDRIPRAARVVAVADRFDRLTAPPPAGQALPLEQALDRLRGEGGGPLDPVCVSAFCDLGAGLAALLPRRGPYAPDVHNPRLARP